MLKETYADLGVLLLSQSLEARYVTDLVRRYPRALGYLLKDRVTDVGVLVEALHRVRDGGMVLDPDVVTHLLGRGDLASQLTRLTARETSVLRADGRGAEQPGHRAGLHIDPRTVESHVSSIFTKLDLPGVHRREPQGPGGARLAAALTGGATGCQPWSGQAGPEWA